MWFQSCKKYCVVAAVAVLVTGCSTVSERGSPGDPAACIAPGFEQPTLVASAYDSGLPKQAQWRDGFVLADMNGDGFVDLVHGPPRKSFAGPIIYLGNGKGGFRIWGGTHFPPLPFDYGDIAVGDLNKDGLPDLVVSSHLRGIAAMINETQGHFAPWGNGLVMVDPAKSVGDKVFASRAIELVDWNGDGQLDIVAANEGPALYAEGRAPSEMLRIYLGLDREWQLLDTKDTVTGFAEALTIGDLHGDGTPEAITGSGVTGNRRLVHVGFGSGPTSILLDAVPESAIVTTTALSSDRRLMLGTQQQSADDQWCTRLLQVTFLTSGGTRHADVAAFPGKDRLRKLLWVDLDDDADEDLITLTTDRAMRIFRAERGQLVPDLDIPALEEFAGCNAFDMAVSDLDGDRRHELIVSYAGDDGSLSDDLCRSRGGFATWTLSPIP